MFEKAMRLPRYGFTVEERKKVMDLDQAHRVLACAHPPKITSAVRKGDTVEITRHVLVCPCCGKETPACHDPEHPKQWVDSRQSQQLSLFGQKPKTAAPHAPVQPPAKFVCRRCHTVSYQSKGFLDVLFQATHNTIKVLRKLSLQDLLRMRWGASKLRITNLELYETITFHLQNGHTFVALEDSRGSRLQVCDVTNLKASRYAEDPIFELLHLYKPVNRELKKLFARRLPRPLPFRPSELTVEAYILMTRFIGYDAAFYQALPYSEGETLMEKRFSRWAKRLHLARNAPAILEKTSLPKVKSIRKAFFQSPALFFYTPQLEKLWEIIQDVNWFRELITSNHIFRELLWLCKMPRILHFYAGYRAVFGVRALLNQLSGHSHQWHEYAMWYGMLSPYDQRAERQKWRKRFSDEDGLLFCSQDNMGAWFSVPVPGASAEGKGLPSLECCMDGYSFKKLRNSAEYIQTGKELHNCLTGWQNFEHSTVYKIMKGTQCVAAVEIQDDVILQAYTDRNGEISDNKNLKQAFDRWKDQHMLRMR